MQFKNAKFFFRFVVWFRNYVYFKMCTLILLHVVVIGIYYKQK